MPAPTNPESSPVVVRFDNGGQRSAFAQRCDVARNIHGSDSGRFVTHCVIWFVSKIVSRPNVLIQRRLLVLFALTGCLGARSAIRVLTSFRTRVAGKGLSTGKRSVPLLVS